MNFNWILFHLLPSLGFILALVLLSKILRERRSPTSTLAWLMTIIFIPYLGVPLYLIFGGRKMMRKVETKPILPVYQPKMASDGYGKEAYISPSGSQGYPPTSNNRLKFLPKGEQAFRELLNLIKNAKHSVCIATFILGKDETGKAIVKALAEQASKGVKICLLLDALGSAKMTRRLLLPLQKAGGRVAFFMPMLHLPFRGRANLRNHRKMIITDCKTAIIGGMNLASEYMGPEESIDRWQDLSLLIEGSAVDHLIDIFRSDWKFASKEDFPNSRTPDQLPDAIHNNVVQVVASGPDVSGDLLRNAILTAIFRAKQRVWIITPYFVPDELLVETLCIAASRNIDVSVVIPQKSNHRLADLVRESYLGQLQEAGAGVFLYQPRMLHAKAILVDDTVAVVGSANMDMRSLLLNYEIALCIYSPDSIRELEVWMQQLRSDCLIQKKREKSSLGLIEGVGRLFAPLL